MATVGLTVEPAGPSADLSVTDDYGSDWSDLARASEEIRCVVHRLQDRLASDFRFMAAERALLEAERAVVWNDRQRADRAARSVEEATAALTALQQEQRQQWQELTAANAASLQMKLCALRNDQSATSESALGTPPGSRVEFASGSACAVAAPSRKNKITTMKQQAQVEMSATSMEVARPVPVPPTVPPKNSVPPMPRRTPPQAVDRSHSGSDDVEESHSSSIAPQRVAEPCGGASAPRSGNVGPRLQEQPVPYVDNGRLQTSSRVPFGPPRLKEPPVPPPFHLQEVSRQGPAGSTAVTRVKEPPVPCAMPRPEEPSVAAAPKTPSTGSTSNAQAATASTAREVVASTGSLSETLRASKTSPREGGTALSAAPRRAETPDRSGHADGDRGAGREEVEETARWAAEVEGPPCKSPPPQSPYYRHMPPPLQAESLGVTAALPPVAAQTPDVSEEVPYKAMPPSRSSASLGGAATATGSPEPVSDSNWSTVTETQEPRLQEAPPRPQEPEGELFQEPPQSRGEDAELRELWAAPAKASNRLFKAPPLELMTRPAAG